MESPEVYWQMMVKDKRAYMYSVVSDIVPQSSHKFTNFDSHSRLSIYIIRNHVKYINIFIHFSYPPIVLQCAFAS